MRALALLAVCACSAGPPGPSIDAARAMQHVEALVAIGPRPGDSAPAEAALHYLEAELARLGVASERVPVGAVTVPAIDVLGMHMRDARRVVTTDPDLVARFGPPGPALLFMAHYDTMPGSPGAVDDGASCALLLELARVWSTAPPAAPVLIAFTANEERSLIGAEALADARGSQVSLAIALDLIGGTGELSLNGASKLIGRNELRWLAAAADRAGVDVHGPLPHRVMSRWFPIAERADHGAFTRRGIRAMHFYHRGQDGERIDLAYHSPRDVLARVDRAHVAEMGRLALALAAEAPPAPDPDEDGGFWLPLATNTVVPRAALIGAELLLAALAAFALVLALRTTRARGGLGLLVGLVAYAAATALALGTAHLAAGEHPAPWLHAPLRYALAAFAILAGALYLATRALGRLAAWSGDRRYLAAAIAVQLALGGALLALGAAELAWIWLVPAAATALAPHAPRPLALPLVLVNALPAALALAPNTIREAAWNAVWPTDLPIGWGVVVLALPLCAAIAWWARRRGASGPLGTLVLSVGSGLAIAAGAFLLLHASPPCSAAEFHDFHLACEALPGVR